MKSLSEYLLEVSGGYDNPMLIVDGVEYTWKKVQNIRDSRGGSGKHFAVFGIDNGEGFITCCKSYGDAAAKAVRLDLIGPESYPAVEEYWMKPYGKTMQDFLHDYNIQIVDSEAHFNLFVPMNFENPGWLECAWVCRKVEHFGKGKKEQIDYHREKAIDDISQCIGKRRAEAMVDDMLNNRKKYGLK